MGKFQQYQTTKYNSPYNSTGLNINQLYDNDQNQNIPYQHNLIQYNAFNKKYAILI